MSRPQHAPACPVPARALAPLLALALALAAVALVAPGLPDADAATITRSVSLTAPSQVKPGTTFHLKGRVSRTPRGSKVSLQRRATGAWRTVATVTTRSSAGDYDKALRINTPGRYTYRAVAWRMSWRGDTLVRKGSPIRTVEITSAAPASTLDRIRQRVLSDVNRERAARGLPRLILSSGINTVAQRWSQTMNSRGELAHNPSFDEQMPSGWTRVGENVACGYPASAVVDAWMGSAGHRANILGDYTHMGVGYVAGSGCRHWFTQNFGKY